MKFLHALATVGLFLTPLAIAIDSTPKANRGYHPANPVTCITPTDSSCLGTAVIAGRCELSIDGKKGTFPCSDLKLVMKAEKENFSREAQLDGYKIVFPDLVKGSTYRLNAQSDQFDLKTEPESFTPTDNANIRIRAKPRP